MSGNRNRRMYLLGKYKVKGLTESEGKELSSLVIAVQPSAAGMSIDDLVQVGVIHTGVSELVRRYFFA